MLTKPTIKITEIKVHVALRMRLRVTSYWLTIIWFDVGSLSVTTSSHIVTNPVHAPARENENIHRCSQYFVLVA